MNPLLAKSFVQLCGLMPPSVANALGKAIGKLLYLIPNRRRRTAQTNLELCFPEKSADEREQLLRQNLIELGKSVIEVGRIWTVDKNRFGGLIHAVHGEDELKRRLKEGKGVILGLPHLGAWEVVGLYASMNYPFTALYRPHSNAIADFVHCARQRFGAHLAPTDNNGIRALYKALERGELVGILPDQVPAQRSSSVFAPFFGVPASTMVLLSRLAAKTGAPVMFVYAARLPHELKYELHFLPAPAEIGHGDIASSAAIVNRMVERCVRARPEQYQWYYKRFRVRPPGQPAIY